MPEPQCLKFDGWNEAWSSNMEGADAAPCFLERLSEAMLQWGWRLAAEIEISHLKNKYIYIYIQPPTRLKREPSCFQCA